MHGKNPSGIEEIFPVAQKPGGWEKPGFLIYLGSHYYEN